MRRNSPAKGPGSPAKRFPGVVASPPSMLGGNRVIRPPSGGIPDAVQDGSSGPATGDGAGVVAVSTNDGLVAADLRRGRHPYRHGILDVHGIRGSSLAE